MNISIDSRSINVHAGSGIGTYTTNLVFNLIHKNTNHFTLFWTGKINNKFLSNNTTIYEISNRHSTFYDKMYIPKIIKENKIDLYHIPQNGIGFPFDSDIKTVVTIHDLIPYTMPETVGIGYLKRFINDMPRIIDNAHGIITVSEFSKRDILRFFPSYPEDRIFVTPLAANNNFIPLNKKRCIQYIKRIYGIDKSFILYLGGFSSRKNVKKLITSFMRVKTDLKKDYLLVLGGSIKDEGKKLQDLCSELGLNNNVVFPGFIPDNLIPIFYNACECFVYPSLYEGFGLPPLEAMSCKVPVITSNLTSIPEVTGLDSAYLINSYEDDELEKGILSVLNNEGINKTLSENGYQKSLQYSWRLTSKNTMECYKKLLSSNS